MEFNVSNLSKTYKNNPVISVFTYQFRSGIYLLTGPNGKGKSTLLKLFSRIIRPSNRDYQMDYVRTCYLCEKIELLSYNSYSFLHAITKLNNIETDLKSLIDKWKIPK